VSHRPPREKPSPDRAEAYLRLSDAADEIAAFESGGRRDSCGCITDPEGRVTLCAEHRAGVEAHRAELRGETPTTASGEEEAVRFFNETYARLWKERGQRTPIEVTDETIRRLYRCLAQPARIDVDCIIHAFYVELNMPGDTSGAWWELPLRRVLSRRAAQPVDEENLVEAASALVSKWCDTGQAGPLYLEIMAIVRLLSERAKKKEGK